MRRLDLIFIIACCAWTGVTLADPVEWPMADGGNGHFYEVIGGAGTPYSGLTWTEADAVAKTLFQGEMAGHLVTIGSIEELDFIHGLPGVPCDYVFGGEACDLFHVGGWALVIEVLDPRPYNPPYVALSEAQWITAEPGVAAPPAIWSVEGPVGAVVHFQLGLYSLDGFGYPDYGLFSAPAAATGSAFIVEYDGLAATRYPDGTVATEDAAWGAVKALYR